MVYSSRKDVKKIFINIYEEENVKKFFINIYEDKILPTNFYNINIIIKNIFKNST